MFDKKKYKYEERIKKLYTDIDNLAMKLSACQSELEVKNRIINRLIEHKKTQPADCVRGEYCKACVFNKSYRVSFGEYRDDVGNQIPLVYDYCAKGEHCKHFVQREVTTNDQT